MTFTSLAAFVQYAPSKKNPKALSTLPLHKIAYILCNLLTLGVGLWKCRSMGLLPTGTGDWLAFESRGVVCCFGWHPVALRTFTLFIFLTGFRDIFILILM